MPLSPWTPKAAYPRPPAPPAGLHAGVEPWKGFSVQNAPFPQSVFEHLQNHTKKLHSKQEGLHDALL